jgi:tRNA1Val (adenine37-N6)-methyltransferase
VVRSTNDALFGGRITLVQPARGEGYRANVDALLLADFAAGGAGETRRARVAYDLGAGVGAVALALFHRDAAGRAVLVEVDEDAARLADENLAANGFAERAVVVARDVTSAARAHRGEADLVVCNPPYVAPGRGRAAKGASRASARLGDVSAFVAAARLILGRRGRAAFIYPARELVTFLHLLRARGLEAKRLRTVRATANDPARVVLVEAMPAKAGGLVVEPELVEREEGAPTPEMIRITLGAALPR